MFDRLLIIGQVIYLPNFDEFQQGHWSNAQFDSTDFSGLVNGLDDLVELVEENQATTTGVQSTTPAIDVTTDLPATTNVNNVTVVTDSAEGILLKSSVSTLNSRDSEKILKFSSVSA